MTDAMSEAFGRQLVEQKAFDRETIWAPLLAAHHHSAGQPIITGKTFTDCLIEGPAVIAPLDGTILDGCDLGAVKNPASLFFKAQGPMLVGVIGFQDCKFVRCQFRQIAFTGSDTAVDQMRAGLESRRAERN